MQYMCPHNEISVKFTMHADCRVPQHFLNLSVNVPFLTMLYLRTFSTRKLFWSRKFTVGSSPLPRCVATACTFCMYLCVSGTARLLFLVVHNSPSFS